MGCECPFASTTAESSAVAPTLSRVNSLTFIFKAPLSSPCCSDFQFRLTNLRVFTLPSSLKRRCPHPRGSRGTPPFQLAQRKGEDVLTFHTIIKAFLTTSIALLHCATPVQSTKYERVDGNSTGLFGTQRGAKHIGRQTQWQTPTCTYGGRNKLDASMAVDTDCCVAASIRACSMSVDITIPDCSS